MSDELLSPELLGYMVKGLQVDVQELRRELHGDYLNAAQMKNVFLTREEQEREQAIRRDWPTRLFAGLAALGAMFDAIVRLAGH